MIFKRFDSVATWTEDIVSVFCLTGIVVIVARSVFGHYVLHTGFLWTNEVSQILFVAMGMFGNTRAVRSNSHAGFTSLVNNRRSGTARAAIRTAINILTIVLLIFMFVISMQFTLGGTMRSTAFRIPRMCFCMSIPMGSGPCIYEYLEVVKTKILTDAASEDK